MNQSARRNRRANAHPTVVLLGNSTVRLIPTDGVRLRANAAVELPTAQFLQTSFKSLPSSARGLLAAAHPLVVCSVHREALAKLSQAARQSGQPLHRYGADFGPGLAVRLPAAAAQQVGRDRLAACAAAIDEFPQGALVCDIGTALTINRVTPRGFEGGLIAPGVQLGLAALHTGTSQLPPVAAGPARFPAKNTAAAMRLGCLTAVAGAIEKVYRAESARSTASASPRRKSGAKSSSGASLPLILTGGSVIIIQPFLTLRALWRPQLVATGVWTVFCREFGRERS
ncbi:MAG TPA: type III pantothenate kinase [Planctomycetota bacterium]|nr:type III pantothenate kinase [Planctomycetota bacterium]